MEARGRGGGEAVRDPCGPGASSSSSYSGASAIQHRGGGGRRDGGGRGREELRRERLDGQVDVVLAGLGGEGALGLVAVPLALAVLLVRVLHRDLLVHEVLAVHVGDGVVARLEGAEADEAVAFAEVGVVAGDLVEAMLLVEGLAEEEGWRRGWGEGEDGQDEPWALKPNFQTG